MANLLGIDIPNGVITRTHTGVHIVVRREEGAWQEAYEDYGNAICKCGRRITTPATGDGCLVCWVKARRS